MSDLKSELKTSKLRIESLENWITRNDEDKKAMKKDIEECSKHASVLSEQKENSINQNEAAPKSVQQKCKKCGKLFSKNSDFEHHLEVEHNVDKSFRCELCGKGFVLEWRLKKHRSIHTLKPKHCKFFLNKEPCPFDMIGCKFAHEDPDGSDIETVEDEDTLNENQCHLCRLQFSSRDDLMDHVEVDHADYFQGMKEYAAANRNLIFL